MHVLSKVATALQSFMSYHPIPWRGSISRPIAPVSLVTGGDDTTEPRSSFLQAVAMTIAPRRQGRNSVHMYVHTYTV
jgi:hypothetical protein